MNNREFEKKYYNDRKKSNSVKWQEGRKQNCLPMWIADMDFRPDEKIVKALNDFISYGDYGYATLPEDYYEVLNNWSQTRHNISINKEWVRFSQGAIDGLYQILYALTNEKDGVMINTPVYHPFKATIKETKRTVIESPLINNNGYFTFDYKDIEKKFAKGNVKAIILCSPHNPVGRVWKKGELEELLDLCHKYHVLIISDEVHNDLIMPDQEFIPTLAFKKFQNETIVFSAVSKTFSFPVYQNCHVIIPSKKLRTKFDTYQKHMHRKENDFNALPTYYGYKYGAEWLDTVNRIIFENYNYFYDKLAKYYEITPLEGSYLIFVNIGKHCPSKNASDYLIKKCHILTNSGEAFGGKKYKKWVRVNLATSLANVKKAVKELEKIAK
ncbi:MAG: aminotransferase class I/II-fold pyridoxal phosphate-dependent enzyme [Erysipelotrichaceae bacterium]|nr:aminotransferase class I/II-fold pyridoxal phosphate-dependent enzyme [Erysipelotrichaceae bacterium]